MLASSSRLTEPLLVILVTAFVAPQAFSQSAVSVDLLPSDWASIHSAVNESQHSAKQVAGGFEAHNRGQSWRANFDSRGFQLEPYTAEWSWGLDLVRYGFAGRESELGDSSQAVASAIGGNVFYEWSATLEEWFVNDERGLEHGFTLRERPARPANNASLTPEFSPLAFDLRVRGQMKPAIDSSRKGVRFVDQSGATVLNYSGLTVFDANGTTLDSWFEPGPEGFRIAIDERKARYPITIDPVVQQAYLKASNTGVQDNFGDAVAVSGNTIVVGARFERSNATGVNGDQSINGFFGSGAAYVFVKAGSTWSQQAYLKASNTHSAARFGSSVAISGDTIVVGAEFERHSSTGVDGDQTLCCKSSSGSAYVFVRNGTTWSQQAYLKASNSDDGDEFGCAIAIDGDTIVVGALREESRATGIDGDQADNSAPRTGAAYVFHRTGSVWTQQAYLKASNSDGGDLFGVSVSVSGESIVVGANGEASNASKVNGDETNNSAPFAGAAYIFERDGSTWTQEAYLKPNDTDTQDTFGFSVSISGDTVLVGAPDEDSNATGVHGDGSDNSKTGSGAAFLFAKDPGGDWAPRAYLKASNPDNFDNFGWSVAISGITAAVGARSEDSKANGVNANQLDNDAAQSGAVYVFNGNGPFWGQQAYLKSSNSGSQDQFGSAVAVANNILVVGAYEEESDSTGIDGPGGNNNAAESGAAYAFNVPKGLSSDVLRVNLTTGGEQVLTLDGGSFRADWYYFMFGSVTGTSPGIDFGNEVVLPLNFDIYFNLILNKPGLAPFGNYFGQLDSNGVAVATFSLPPGTDPSLAGVSLHHAFVAAESLGTAELASNAVIVILSL